MSDLVELAGFGALVEGVNLLLGRGAAFVAVGLVLLFIGATIDDEGVTVALHKTVRLPFVTLSRVRRSVAARKARRESGSRLPAVRA